MKDLVPEQAPCRIERKRRPAHRGRIRAPAKINLSLRITGRRADGYHLIDSAVLPIGLFDEISFAVDRDDAPGVSLVCRPVLPGNLRDNLAWRAAELFLAKTGWRARVDLSLSKQIPIGAGLGGGSSDAAGVLRLLQTACGFAVAEDCLREWALELGADVPFFLFGRPARVRGIGDHLEPLADWPKLPLLVVYGGKSLATADVYRAYDRSLTSQQGGSKEFHFVSGESPGSQLLVNDLEAAAFRLCSDLPELKQRLGRLGASGALMTGSGSAIFSLWESREAAENAAEQLRNDGLWARTAEILPRVPEADIE